MGLGQDLKKAAAGALAGITFVFTGAASLNAQNNNTKPALPLVEKTASIRSVTRLTGKTSRTDPAAQIITTPDGTVLWGQNETLQRQPASMTKLMIMTVMLDWLKEQGPVKAAEILRTPVEIVPADKARTKQRPCLSISPLKKPTFREIWQMASVDSCNEAAAKLATLIGGSEEQAVRKMNDLSRKLGMKQTEWGNASGLPDRYTMIHENTLNLTTPADLIKLVKYIYDTHKDSLGDLARDGITVQGVRYNNTNGLVHWSEDDLGKAIGARKARFIISKTGTTNAAGPCVMGAVEIEDMDGTKFVQFLAVMGSSPVPGSRINNVIDLLKEGVVRQRLENARVKPAGQQFAAGGNPPPLLIMP